MEETLQTNLNKDNAPLTDDAKTTNSKYDSLKKLKYKDCKRVSIHTEYDYYFNQITTLRFDNKSGKCVSTNESANLSDIIVESCGDNNNINEAVAIVAAGRQDKVTANAGDKLLEKATTSVKVDSKKDTTDPTKDANKPIKDKTKTDQTVSNKVDSPDEENPLALLAEMRRQYKEQKKANKV
ncbi:MAG: hypothetical protein LBE09_03210, partial [Christensenellaceae bacterium]|nr:hypothetical protein [Christensenellaceae bacterium]